MKKSFFIILSTFLIFSSCHLKPIIKSKIKKEGKKQESRLYPVTVDGKLGYIDKTGKIIIEPQFQSADRQDLYVGQFSEGLAFVRLDNKFGYIDMTGNIVVETKFDGAYQFSEGLARIKIEGKYGFIDKQGNIVIKPEFKKAGDFSEGLAPVEIQGRWDYINKKGKVVINKQFDWADEFSEDLAWVMTNEILSCIDKKGNIAFSLEKKDLDVIKFSEGLSRIKKGKESRYIDKTGKTIIESYFHDGLIFTEGLAAACTGGVFKKFNKGMRAYQRERKFFEYGYWRGDKWGYIDKTGKFVIEPIYNQAYPFSNGLAAVVLKDMGNDYQVGYIDKTGKYVIEPITVDAGSTFDEE
ncbi:WG repeat-containing protein, partial [bacterium]|nr:WG repeat-containing protein [bacterium]